MRKLHKNPNGNWCRCPWGQGNTDPYIPASDREVVGAMWHEASKIEWLRGREDLQSREAKAFLDSLEAYLYDHDSLYPWLVREWKKGNLTDESYYPRGQYQDSLPFTYKTADGNHNGLENEDLHMLQNWMKYRKQNKQGVDIMKHEIGHVLPEASKWDAGGDLIYTDPITGHELYHLRNKRDLRVEGRRMQHCIGSNGQNYIQRLEDGDGLYYSIRHGGDPEGTLEMHKRQDHYYQCPNGHFTPGEEHYNLNKDIYETSCDKCGAKLTDSDDDLLPDVKAFNTDLRKMAKKPDSKLVKPGQFYGFSDGRVPYFAEDALNRFFKQHGHDWIRSSTQADPEDDDEFEFENAQNLEDAGYETSYEHDAPDTFDDLVQWHEDPHHMAPPEFRDAMHMATENGWQEPTLSMDGDIDWSRILDNLVKKDEFSPENYKKLWDIAKENGSEDELNDVAQNWLRDEYHYYLDPYGESHRPGFMGIDYNKREVTLPSHHYPGAQYPHEEYVARNLEHFMNRNKIYDPQSGNYLSPIEAEKLYPWQTPQGQGISAPVEVPIPERQGYPDIRPERVHLPYGRDVEMTTQDATGTPNYVNPVNPGSRFGPPPPTRLPTAPDQAFGPEDTRYHQPPLPGIPNAFNPMDNSVFPAFEQQGQLMPPQWYVDYESGTAKKTDLPRHLFPPDRYGWHYEAQPGEQGRMWDNNVGNGEARINTFPFSQRQRVLDQGLPDPVWGQWNASTKESSLKESGEWTDYEEANKVPSSEETPSHQGIGYNNNSIVQFNPERFNGQVFTMPGFEWRIPLLYHHPTGRTYVGREGMEHGDLARQFSLPKPWNEHMDPNHEMQPGFIDLHGGRGLGQTNGEAGSFQFYGDWQHPNPDELSQWVSDQYGLNPRKVDHVPITDEDMWSEASYHPLQDDEWVDGDIADFSATIPEGRWKSD